MTCHSSFHSGRSIPGVVAGAISLALATSTAMAESRPQGAGLEEVIVTAQRRQENLQQSAVAVTAVSAETLSNLNVDTFSDIARLAPSVQMGGLNANQLVIRGVGQQQPGLFSEQGAAIYVDGVYRPRFSLNSVNFSDVERMEVLRGPQGTLYGKNAVGGAVNIVTYSGGADLGGDVQAQYGSRQHTKLDASINIPLVGDRLIGRMSYSYNKQDGYIDDVFSGEKLSDTNYYAVHGSLRWKLTDDVIATLRADYFNQDQSGFGYVLLDANRGNTPPTSQFPARDAALKAYLQPSPYQNAASAGSFNKVNDKGTSLSLDWTLPLGVLKSTTAYREHDNRVSADADGTPLTARSSPSDLFEHFFSQELQYNLALFADRLNWSTGAFWYEETGQNNSRLRDNNDVLSGTPSRTSTLRNQDATSSALYSQATYTAFDKLGITLGARYSKEKKAVDATGFNDNTGAITTATLYRQASWNAFTPKLTVQYQFTPDFMSYVSASRGYKAGGYNTSVQAFLPYDPEYVWNYELGVKSEWLNRRLRVNLTAYQMNYTDIQLNQILPSSTGTLPLVTNAGDAKIKGGEIEIAFAATDNLLLTAGAGVNDFKYTRLATGATVNTSNVLPNSPKTSATAGAEYGFQLGNGKLALRGDYSYRSKTYFDANNNEATRQDAYGLWGGRVTYTSTDHWAVFAYGSNLTDKYYRVAAFAVGITSVLPGAPREVGIGFKAGFGQ